MDKKVCKKCNVVKVLIGNFYKRNQSKDGYEHTCIQCRRKANAIAHQARYSPNKRRDQHLLKKYNINQAAYILMLIKQDSKCAICGNADNGRVTDQFFVVDHCHSTGLIRGLLCHPCNTALGGFRDNVNSLRNAIDYLERFDDA
jgi:hypothetical protein